MLYQKKSVSLQKLFRCDIMTKNAKTKIDWSAILEVLIFVISAVKELVKKANEQEPETKETKKIGNKDEKTNS